MVGNAKLLRSRHATGIVEETKHGRRAQLGRQLRVIFDRLLAAFKEAGNVGFLMYIADAIGYLGSVAVMLWRNFGHADMSWLQFFGQLCWWGAGAVMVLSLLSWVWFARRAVRVKPA